MDKDGSKLKPALRSVFICGQRTIALLIFIVVVASLSVAQSEPQLNRDPAMVKFVTSDIGNFWCAYDLAAKETDKPKLPKIARLISDTTSAI